MHGLERRVACELRSAGGSDPRLAGYAAVWDAPSEGLPGFTEFVRAGAFTRSLSGGADVVALVHHNPGQVLGRSGAGTLRLQEDGRGLAFEIDLPDTGAGRDVGISVARGDMRGASFAFTVPPSGDRWSVRGNRIERELLDVDLMDITITALPTYPETTVARRALAAYRTPVRLRLAQRFLETV